MPATISAFDVSVAQDRADATITIPSGESVYSVELYEVMAGGDAYIGDLQCLGTPTGTDDPYRLTGFSPQNGSNYKVVVSTMSFFTASRTDQASVAVKTSTATRSAKAPAATQAARGTARRQTRRSSKGTLAGD